MPDKSVVQDGNGAAAVADRSTGAKSKRDPVGRSELKIKFKAEPLEYPAYAEVWFTPLARDDGVDEIFSRRSERLLLRPKTTTEFTLKDVDVRSGIRADILTSTGVAVGSKRFVLNGNSEVEVNLTSVATLVNARQSPLERLLIRRGRFLLQEPTE